MLALIPDWLGWIIGGAIALAATWFGGRISGKTAAKVDDLKDEVKAHEIRNEVENRIASERDARQRLHDDWGR